MAAALGPPAPADAPRLARLVGSTGTAAEGASEVAPAARLFDALLVLWAALALGRAAAACGFVEAASGRRGSGGRDTGEPMSFLVAKIALPLLAFSSAASADLGSFDLGVLASCMLGKAVTYAVALGAAAACGGGARGGALPALLAAASDDFAVGLPAARALGAAGRASTHEYVTASAVLGAALLAPLSEVLVGRRQAVGAAGSGRGCCPAAARCRGGPLGPTAACALLGLLCAALLGPAGRGSAATPLAPLVELARLLSSPFVACSLFLTGARLHPLRVSLVSALAAAAKVLLCPVASGAFGGLLVGAGALRGWPAVYGALPSGGLALSQLDPLGGEAAELVSAATLLSFVLACPVMLSVVLFEDIGGDPAAALLVLDQVQLSASTASVVCGVALLLLLAAMAQVGSRGACGPSVQLLAWYVCAAAAAQALLLALRPGALAESAWRCEEFSRLGTTQLATLISWLQNACRLLLLLIQGLAVAGPLQALRRPWQLAALALACLLCARGAAELGLPSGVGEVCHRSTLPSRAALLGNLAWLGSLLVLGCAVAVLAARRARGPGEEDEGDPGASDSPSSGASSDAEEPAKGGDDAQEKPAKGGGQQRAPSVAISAAFALMLMRLLLQAANAAQVLYTGLPMGVVPEALVLEAVLEQGQLVWLLLAAAFDEEVAAAVAEACHLGPATREEDSHEELELLEVPLCAGAAHPAEEARAKAPAQGPLCLVVSTTVIQPGVLSWEHPPC